jgi:post-segregation antitoxin (ccd killing protein)
MKVFAEKLARSEKRLREMKGGIEAKVLANDFIFPLFRSLGVDVEEALVGLNERLEGVEDAVEGGDLDLLEDARNVILRLAGLVDSTMIAAGFFEATDKGLRKTAKAPADLAQDYDEVGAQVVEVIREIEEELSDEDEEDDDGPDGDPGEPAAVVGAITPAAAPDVLEAPRVAVTATAASIVDADVVEAGGTPALTVTPTEHDTDAA